MYTLLFLYLYIIQYSHKSYSIEVSLCYIFNKYLHIYKFTIFPLRLVYFLKTSILYFITIVY